VSVGPECGARVGVPEPAGKGPDAEPASGQCGGGEVAQQGEGDVGSSRRSRRARKAPVTRSGRYGVAPSRSWDQS
jgi:hypothetical protein